MRTKCTACLEPWRSASSPLCVITFNLPGGRLSLLSFMCSCRAGLVTVLLGVGLNLVISTSALGS